ncbi:MAG TPA: CsgG/HfaB family protein, partial [Candidatus Saccharimonadales bacterium]|nr:CsgG/HfaB family protein [Candidatus Saccharimonadales bacterium]
MKKVWLLAGLLVWGHTLAAQSNVPIRLAVVAETGSAFEPDVPASIQGFMSKFGTTLDAADLLTAQLSTHVNLQLLERNEIEKVYREQSLSAENHNDLKLGQILGADGVLLLRLTHGPDSSHLSVRLIAVKAGAVVLAETFTGSPRLTLPDWASAFATQLEPFLPKLAVPGKDAIPISIVNFRGAVRSPEAAQMEQQLRLLTIERLSQEPRFFVLERQQMGLLGGEKELKLDDSAFWNGRYLLEGVVDQNGYSPEILTLDARLTPAKGGAPVLMHVSGSRTNLAEAINRLATKISDTLKLNSTVPDWKPGEEAAQYFAEAKWALKWGMDSEAQTAADSAWALGKRDLEEAVLRVKSYIASPDKMAIDTVHASYGPGTDAVARYELKVLSSNHVAVTYKRVNPNLILFYAAKQPLDIGHIDWAIHALDLYLQFSQTLPPTEPQVTSEWYGLGIEDLASASGILRQFYTFPEFREPVAEKLGILRASARAVAQWISKSPSVRDSYFISDRIATRDELIKHIAENPNIFGCKVTWGAFWQETPEDCVALYRELLHSPVFGYIHSALWSRGDGLLNPRLIAWTREEQKRVPAVWNEFLLELDASTNLLWRLEAKALRTVDAPDEQTLGMTFTNFFDSIFENREALVACPVDIMYLQWNARGVFADHPVSHTRDVLEGVYNKQYFGKLNDIGDEYWRKTIPAIKFLPLFKQQEQLLAAKGPFDFSTFADTFSYQTYSPAQAREILPLIADYKTNLTIQAESQTGLAKQNAQSGLFFAGFLEDSVKRILNPSPVQQPIARDPSWQYVPPGAMGDARQRGSMAQGHALPTGPALLITNYRAFPRNQFTVPPLSPPRVANQRWSHGQLLLDLHYNIPRHQDDWRNAPPDSRIATAIFNPSNDAWNILEHPIDAANTPMAGWAALFDRNRSGRCFEVFHGNFYLGEDRRFKRCNLESKRWENLPIPCQTNTDLFTIDDHLYAASSESIFEINDDGRTTRLLASTRRRPAVSALDSLDDLGSPILFARGGHTLCAGIGNKVYQWNGTDWQELFPLEFTHSPEVSEGAVIFRHYYSMNPGCLWLWANSRPAPELALYENASMPYR